VLGPLLAERAAEFGVQVSWIDRTYYSSRENRTYRVDGSDFAIVARYGLSRYATISAELWTGPGTGATVTGLPDVDGARHYIVGGGLQGLVWTNGVWQMTAAGHVTETYTFFPSESVRDVTIDTFGGEIQIERSLRAKGQAFSLWGGVGFYPSDFDLWSTTTPGHVDAGGESDWGGHLGGDAVLFDHLVVRAAWINTGGNQPRLSLYYRF
jgi:hypothetical protein